MHLAKRFMPLVLALPLVAAAADPMRVTTTFSGQMQPNQLVLWQMGFGDIDDSAPLPFTLTLSNTLAPERPWSRDGWTEYNGRDFSFTLTLGEQVFSYAGDRGLTTVGSDGVSHFRNEVFYEDASYHVSIRTWIDGPPGSMDGDPLATRGVAPGPAVSGGVYFLTSYANPDAPGVWSMGANADVAMLTVVSAVPEPAAGGMLLAGLAVCAAALRRRRFSRQA